MSEQPGRAPGRSQAGPGLLLEAEPGLKQSSGLFVPGEEPDGNGWRGLQGGPAYPSDEEPDGNGWRGLQGGPTYSSDEEPTPS